MDKGSCLVPWLWVVTVPVFLSPNSQSFRDSCPQIQRPFVCVEQGLKIHVSVVFGAWWGIRSKIRREASFCLSGPSGIKGLLSKYLCMQTPLHAGCRAGCAWIWDFKIWSCKVAGSCAGPCWLLAGFGGPNNRWKFPSMWSRWVRETEELLLMDPAPYEGRPQRMHGAVGLGDAEWDEL